MSSMNVINNPHGCGRFTIRRSKSTLKHKKNEIVVEPTQDAQRMGGCRHTMLVRT